MKNNKKTGLLIAGLSLAMLGCTGAAVGGVFAAANQTVAFQGAASFTATKNVSAIVTASVNGEVKSSVEFEKSEVSQSKGGDIALAWKEITADNKVSYECVVEFAIENTSEVYSIDFVSTDSSVLVNASVVSENVSGNVAVGETSTVKYTYSIDDIDLDSSLTGSWSIVMNGNN